MRIERMIKAIVKRVGEDPVVTMIDDSLESLQALVGGYIEMVSVPKGVVICNEEGRLMGLPLNCMICDISFCGTIVVTGDTEDGDLTDVPVEWLKGFGILKESLV